MPVFARQLKALDHHSPDAIKLIANHIRTMQEELEYRLAHLDSSNVDEINMEETRIYSSNGNLIEIVNETEKSIAKITIDNESIKSTVEDLEDRFSSSIEQTDEWIKTAVSQSKQYTDEKTGEITASLSNYSTIEQTASKISTAVSEMTEYIDTETGKINASLSKYSTIEQTAESISSAVAESKLYTDGAITESLANYSTIEQTASSISTAVAESKQYTDAQTGEIKDSLSKYSTIEQTAESIATAVSESKTYTDGQISASLESYSTTTQTSELIKSEVGSVKEYVDEQTGAITASLQNYSTIEQTDSKIASAVSESKTYTDTETGKITASLANYSTIEQTSSSIQTAVSESKTYTDQKTGAITASLSNYSTITQTANSISAAVTSCNNYTDGKTSTMLKMDSTGVKIIDQNGNTVSITGTNIASKAITTDKLKLYGTLDIYSSTSYATVGGHVGYAKSLQNGTAGMQLASSNRYYVDPVDSSSPMTGMYGEVGVTDNGVRLAHRYRNVSSGLSRVVYMSVYGATSTTPAANVYVDGSEYVFFGSEFRTKNTAALGSSSLRWGQIYTNAAVNTTSDREAKNSIEYDIDPRYDALWSLLKPCTGKYNDGTSGRTHMFLVAQDVEEAVEEAGLTSLDFAAYSKSPREDEDGNIVEGYTYGLRYEEFIPLCIRRIQLLEAKVAAMERS